ncbi:MAG TPA: PEGA domain-containing protein [Polyangia bacterium]|nr:PEGA domain-containing protein [Polyangia bacterium]
MRRRLSGLAVSCALTAVAFQASAQSVSVRVGLADVATSAEGHAAVAALRARLETRPAIALPHDAARAALEEPLGAQEEEGAGEAATRPRAAQLVRAARDAYSRFDYDGALERLRQAELSLATAPPVPDVVRLLVDVNLLVGVVQADRGDAPRALEAFRAAQRLDPARKALDPGSYRPRVVALYAQAAAAPEPRRARLEVVTDPPGAAVWIDGRRAGTSPLSSSLEVGLHYVAAVAEGSAPRLEKPLLRAGEDTRLSMLLSRSPPEDRARQARAELLGGRLAWDRGPAALAAAASLDLLVIVRDVPGARSVAAIYDARTGELGPWRPAAPAEPVLVALATALATAPARASLVTNGAARDPSPAAATPWYRSWWLAPPLIAVGAAVGLGTLWIFDRERTTTYTINRWCFNSTCSK